MKTILRCTIPILLIAVSGFAQQPQPQPGLRFPQSAPYGGYAGIPTAKPSSTNYQLELSVQRGDKTARYKLTLNGGSVMTELMDRFAEKQENAAPMTMSFSASLTPLDEGGGEVNVTLSRSVQYKTKTQVQGAPAGTEKEVTVTKSIPLMTKVALLPGKPVVLFEDEEEKISLQLTSLDSGSEKP